MAKMEFKFQVEVIGLKQLEIEVVKAEKSFKELKQSIGRINKMQLKAQLVKQKVAD